VCVCVCVCVCVSHYPYISYLTPVLECVVSYIYILVYIQSKSISLRYLPMPSTDTIPLEYSPSLGKCYNGLFVRLWNRS
jgi:hypothetical protein